LEAALADLCERKQTLLLATPYLSFESRFIERAGPDLRIRATMSRNVVRHALEAHPLRLRFPWGLTFYAGATRILDYEEGDKAKFLRVATPLALVPDDLRKAYRVDQVGRSVGVLGSQDMTLVKFSVEDVSQHGLRVFCMEPLPPYGFQLGRMVDVSLSLEHGPRLKAQARIAHGGGQTLGLCFTPPLEGPQLDALTSWLSPRIVDARRRWHDRAIIRAKAELAVTPKVPPAGILLVSNDVELQAAMAAALGDTQPLICVPPAMAPFRKAMEQAPPLLLVLAVTSGMDENHRLRAILESVPRHCPMVVLGNGPDMKSFRALASELKATLFLDRNTLNSIFFQKMALGLIRKHWNLLEGGADT
jgi:hypothetical protein